MSKLDKATLSGLLVEAVRMQRLDVVRLLISKQVDVNIVSRVGYSALSYCKSKDMVDTLVANGAKVNPNIDGEFTPLHNAVLYNRIDVVKALISHGACINTTDQKILTPLHVAVRHGYLGMVEYLINQGARTDCTFNGETLIACAVTRSDKAMATLLHWQQCKPCSLNP